MWEEERKNEEPGKMPGPLDQEVGADRRLRRRWRTSMVAQRAPRSQMEMPMAYKRQPPSSKMSKKKIRAPKLKIAAHTTVSKSQRRASVRFWRVVWAGGMRTV